MFLFVAALRYGCVYASAVTPDSVGNRLYVLEVRACFAIVTSRLQPAVPTSGYFCFKSHTGLPEDTSLVTRQRSGKIEICDATLMKVPKFGYCTVSHSLLLNMKVSVVSTVCRDFVINVVTNRGIILLRQQQQVNLWWATSAGFNAS